MSHRSTLAGATAVFLITFALAVTSLAAKSPTFDEQGFVTRGLGYLRAENRHMRVGHPLGLNALNAALLAGDTAVRLPTDHPSWAEPGFHRPSELFLWEIGNDVERVIFLARLPTVWLGLLLTAVAGRWAMELTGRRAAGLVALVLLALDPNILAHTRLATTDLGLAFGALLAGFTLWRWLQRPSWSRLVVAGAAFGLLQDTKFTALLFIPLFGLVILLALLDRRRRGEPLPLTQLLAYPLVALLALWAAYGFQIGTLPAELPTFPGLAGLTLPLSHHLEQLLDIGGRLQQSTPSFLLGDYSDSGWWFYFPVAFLLKTPLPTLLLIVAAVILYTDWGRSKREKADKTKEESVFIRQNRHSSAAKFLLVPALGYFAIALTSEINLGYRHLLPVLPFLFVFTAVSLSNSQFIIHHAPFTILPAIGWLIVANLFIYPHYLAFFNPLAGGPDGGWLALVDSNLDWGQDLRGLADWLDEHDADPIWLSYFGEARPDYYGIDYRGLPSFPPRLMNPEARPFYPHDPAPGLYAISATNLQGVHFQDHDLFAWFRERQPLDKIGYSIFLYDVAARGEPVPLLLGNVQPDEIAPADFARFGGNDVRPRWFDARQALIAPAEAGSWLVLAGAVAPHPALAGLLTAQFEPAGRGQDVTLFRAKSATSDQSLPWQAVEEALARDDGRLRFDAVSLPDGPVAIGSELTAVTAWRQLAEPGPVRLFLHLVAPDGEIVAQWDGLGAAWEGWRDGDTLYQTHALVAPDMPGSYDLYAGAYDPADPAARWTTAAGDGRLFLGQIEVVDE